MGVTDAELLFITVSTPSINQDGISIAVFFGGPQPV
jgi:hypothetical protein